MALLHRPPPPLRLLRQKSSNPSKLRLHQITLLRPSRTNNGITSQLDSLGLTSSVGSPLPVGLSQWSLGRKHVNLLSVGLMETDKELEVMYIRRMFTGKKKSCRLNIEAAISTTWLFFSAIPTLLAFKRAAESMEKLLDVTAEEIPDTMAAVRLSGMEISDLMMELSDIGYQMIYSPTEDRLRRLTAMAPPVPVQSQVPLRDETEGPALARTARNLREGMVKGRAILGVIFGVTIFSVGTELSGCT